MRDNSLFLAIARKLINLFRAKHLDLLFYFFSTEIMSRAFIIFANKTGVEMNQMPFSLHQK